MSESAADITLSAFESSKWQAAIAAGVASGRPVIVSDSPQLTSDEEVKSGVTFIESSVAAVLDLDGTDPAWAAAFPRLKRQSSLVIDANVIERFSCPSSYSDLLVTLSAANVPIKRQISDEVSFNVDAALLSLADDGKPIDAALSTAIDGLSLPATVRAGLLLSNGDDEASHRVSQASEGRSDFDYWHGLMHRREPDFGNASYWFRRVGDHPAYEGLSSELARVSQSVGIDLTAENDPWDAFGVIEFFRRAGDGRVDETTAKLIQHVEYRNLLMWNLNAV